MCRYTYLRIFTILENKLWYVDGQYFVLDKVSFGNAQSGQTFFQSGHTDSKLQSSLFAGAFTGQVNCD
jgi:hypothetical protein